jgi:tetratricopeptide (TPR) repeat protein
VNRLRAVDHFPLKPFDFGTVNKAKSYRTENVDANVCTKKSDAGSSSPPAGVIISGPKSSMSRFDINQKTLRIVFVLVALVVTVSIPLAVCGQNGENDPSDDAVAHFNKGQDAHEKGDLHAAIENYEKALKIIPDFPEAELQRGNAYHSLGKLAEAEVAFRRAVELREDWSLAMASLGSILVRKGSFTEAEAYLTKAIEKDELNFPAYAAMTELRLKTKASPEILRSLLSRIRSLTAKANPTVSLLVSQGALESALGDRKRAKTSVTRALVLDAKNQWALSTIADLALTDGDTSAAEMYVRRLESVAPASDASNGLRARLLIAEGKIDQALALLNSIAKPGAEIIDLKNQIVAATTTDPAELERQLTADPNSTIVLSKLCTAYRVTDPVKALDYCRRASESAPNSLQPVVGYAAALVQAKRYEDAIVVLRRLISIAPDNATVRANLATALFQLKRYPEAKVEFRWLTDHQPDVAAAFYFLGIVHDQLLEFADAAANYQQFLRLANPESSKLEIEKVNLRLPTVQRLIKEGKGKRRG